MLLETYPEQTGGLYNETATLRNIFISLDIRTAHNYEYFTEAMLFGIGGGIHLAHFVVDFGSSTTFVPQGRHIGNYKGNSFQETICQRLGVPALRKETSGEKAAQRYLREAIEHERAVLCWVDLYELPYHGLPKAYEKTFDHVVVPCGIDGSELLLDDYSPRPWRMEWEQFIEARAAIGSRKNRLMTIGGPEASLTLRSAITLGIQHCIDNLLHPEQRDFGVEGIRSWAHDINPPSGAGKTWMDTFDTPTKRYNALRDIHRYIKYGGQMGGGGGGLLRNLFADFLEEAGPLLERPHVADLGPHYRRIAAMWDSVADTALPGMISYLDETRQLLQQKHDLLANHGPTKYAELKKVNAALNAKEKKAKKEFTTADDVFAMLFDQIREQLLEIHTLELEGAENLKLALEYQP